jgi:hypothetical protein
MARYQRGHISEAFGAFHVRYYVTELVDGKPVRKQKSERLCANDARHKLGERFANHRLMTGGRIAEGCDSSQVTDLPLVGQPIG